MTQIAEINTTNVTVKLDSHERERLRSLATLKNRSPHFLMKEAITKYLVHEEANERFVQAARDSLAHYRRTGLHITLDEFNQWVDALKTQPKTPMPACHT